MIFENHSVHSGNEQKMQNKNHKLKKKNVWIVLNIQLAYIVCYNS